jgi:ATP-dependent Clp protease ATP-binding subunit ClpC
MFERFTDRARRVIVLAQEEARTMDHDSIRPEHLFLGLIQAEGVAGSVLEEAQVDLESVRGRVVTAESARARGKRGAKARVLQLPFSPKSKKALEMSLREALRLGHNYIGTEHILLGVIRATEDEADRFADIVGTNLSDLRDRTQTKLQSAGFGGGSLRSPALIEAMDRARRAADRALMTTGHLLTSFVEDGRSQAALALGALGVTADALRSALGRIPAAGTSDAMPGPRSVEIRVGDTSTTIDDPELASTLRDRTPDEIQAALRRAFGSEAAG